MSFETKIYQDIMI